MGVSPRKAEPYRFIQVEQAAEGVRIIRLNRPQVRNALNIATTFELQRAVRELVPAGQRVGILTGAPPAFCAGGDLRELLDVTAKGAEKAAKHVYKGFQGLVRAVRETPVVVISAVNGAAAGGGMDLALACDLCYAGRSASLRQSWVRLGLLPAMGGAYFILRRAGMKAQKIIYTGEAVSGEEAHRMGLVDGLSEDEALLPEVVKIAQQIASAGTTFVSHLKRLVHSQEKASLDKYLREVVKVQGKLLASPEFRKAAMNTIGIT